MPATQAPSTLLIRGVNWLGDAVMTTPALQRIREHLPETHITLLCPEKLADLWQFHPAIDDVLTLTPAEKPWHVARRVRQRNFPATLLFPNSHRAALEAWFARISRRIGYARSWRSWLLTQVVPPRPDGHRMRKRSVGEIRHAIRGTQSSETAQPGDHSRAHQIYDFLHLAGALGADSTAVAPSLHVSEDELKNAAARLVSELQQQVNAPRAMKPVWLGLTPSAAYGPAKRWPSENYAAVAREVARRMPEAVWLLFGGAEDAPLCSELAKRAGGNVVNLAGKTSLRELMGMLALCRTLLTNDSGPMHVAAALGTPVVVPFGSTSPTLTAPGLPGDPRHRLLQVATPCAPCFRRDCPIDLRCMTGITVDRVIAAVIKVLSRAR